MQIEIYADVFFAVNFLMDLLIFWIASKLVRKKIAFKKILFGVLISSVIYLVLVFKFNYLYNFWSSVLILVFAVSITFRPENLFNLVKLIFLIIIIAFALGGMTTVLFYYIDFASILEDFSFKNFSFGILFISTGLAFIFINIFAEYIKKSLISKQVFCEIKIYLQEKKISFNALVDTGNNLRDELTDLPIIIAELDFIKNIFSQEILNAINKKDLEKLFMSNIKFSLTPFKSLGNENGLLICFKPDKIKIYKSKNQIISNALIGIANFSLDNFYHGLINPDLIK